MTLRHVIITSFLLATTSVIYTHVITTFYFIIVFLIFLFVIGLVKVPKVVQKK